MVGSIEKRLTTKGTKFTKKEKIFLSRRGAEAAKKDKEKAFNGILVILPLVNYSAKNFNLPTSKLVAPIESLYLVAVGTA